MPTRQQLLAAERGGHEHQQPEQRVRPQLRDNGVYARSGPTRMCMAHWISVAPSYRCYNRAECNYVYADRRGGAENAYFSSVAIISVTALRIGLRSTAAAASSKLSGSFSRPNSALSSLG